MFFSIIVTIVQFIGIYAISKILVRDRIFKLKEILLIMIASPLFGVTFYFWGLLNFLFIFLFYIYLWMKKLGNIIDAIILSATSLILSVIADHITSIIRDVIGDMGDETSGGVLVIHLSIFLAISLLLAIIASVLYHKFRANNETDSRVSVYTMGLCLLIIGTVFAGIVFVRNLGDDIGLIRMNLLFFAVYIALVLLMFFIYTRALKKTYDAKQKETELIALEHYTENMEKQYAEMRRFRHDYKNILLSLDGYINDGDLEGLKKYYDENIKASPDEISSNLFKLEDLGHIKVKELKSIFALKLTQAQEKKLNSSFEAKDDITKIPMNTVVLVRAIGILLDNAIEEVSALGTGEIRAGIIKMRDSVEIIIMNTCRADLPPVHKLRKEGFSTKGEGRGLGLYNYHAMMDKVPNVFTETIVEHGFFVQKIKISGEV